MIREMIVDLFFSDICLTRSLEANKRIIKDYKLTRDRLSQVERPTNEQLINKLMGRRFTEQEYHRVIELAEICRTA